MNRNVISQTSSRDKYFRTCFTKESFFPRASSGAETLKLVLQIFYMGIHVAFIRGVWLPQNLPLFPRSNLVVIFYKQD